MNTIKAHPVYKQILEENCGGCIYNVANRDNYETSELLALWHSMSASEQELMGGITKGAMRFIQGE